MNIVELRQNIEQQINRIRLKVLQLRKNNLHSQAQAMAKATIQAGKEAKAYVVSDETRATSFLTTILNRLKQL